ncbi:MAG: hypothetical protein ACFFCC_15250 [Promethearchaeota archaeon]
MIKSDMKAEKEKNWLELIEEHPLRHDIWMILDLYNELNVTELTYYVKRSKSTVGRVLTGMEEDNLLISRRGKKERGEKIPPKFYRINPKFKKVEEDWDEEKLPDDPETLQNFYNSKIDQYRNFIKDIEKRFEYLEMILKYFQDQLENIENLEVAKRIYKNFLSDINEPSFSIIRIDKERFQDFLDLRIEYLMKLRQLLMRNEIDENNAITCIDMTLPYSAFFELTKNLKSKKSIKR